MTRSEQLQRLEAVLSAFGSDRTRWPKSDRVVLEALIADDAEAAAAFAREAAFDRVLAAAPHGLSQGEFEGAKERLFAKLDLAPVSATSARASATVVPFASKAAQAIARPQRSLWKELSIMAAALLIGFFTVSSGLLDGIGLDVAQWNGASDPSTGETDDVSAIALGTTGEQASEEDLL